MKMLATFNCIRCVKRWFKKFRWCISRHIQNNPISLGGRNVIIEIDESCFSRKPKHNRGGNLNRPQKWVFGMIERGTRRFVVVVVPDRTANTLIPIIRQYISRDSTIFSDMWRPYYRTLKFCAY